MYSILTVNEILHTVFVLTIILACLLLFYKITIGLQTTERCIENVDL